MSITINGLSINQPTQTLTKNQKEQLNCVHTPQGTGAAVIWKLLKTPVSYNTPAYIVKWVTGNDIISTSTTESLVLNLSGSYYIEIEEVVNGITKKYLVYVDCKALRDYVSIPFPGETTQFNAVDGWARKVETTLQSLSHNEGTLIGAGVATGTEEYVIGDCVCIKDIDNTDISGFFYELQSAANIIIKNSKVGIVIDKLETSGSTIYSEEPIYIVLFDGAVKIKTTIPLYNITNSVVYYDVNSCALTNNSGDHYVGKYYYVDASNIVLSIDDPMYLNYSRESSSGLYFNTLEFEDTDWFDETPDPEYSITFNHNLNSYNLMVEVWDETSPNKVKIEVSRINKYDENTLIMYVTSSPDGTFKGRVNVQRIDNTGSIPVNTKINVSKNGTSVGNSGTLNFIEGTDITLTIAKVGEIDNITITSDIVNADLVHITGNEVIAGNKTFEDNIIIENGITINNDRVDTISNSYIVNCSGISVNAVETILFKNDTDTYTYDIPINTLIGVKADIVVSRLDDGGDGMYHLYGLIKRGGTTSNVLLSELELRYVDGTGLSEVDIYVESDSEKLYIKATGQTGQTVLFSANVTFNVGGF
jgi:hypothetical protein